MPFNYRPCIFVLVTAVDVQGQPFNLVDSKLRMGVSPTGTMTPPIPASPVHPSEDKPQLLRQDNRALRQKHSSEFLRKMEEQKMRSSGSLSSMGEAEEGGAGGTSAESAPREVEGATGTDGNVRFQVGDDGTNLSNGVGNLAQSKHREESQEQQRIPKDSCKPPNVLVYTGAEEEDDVFGAIQAALQHCLEQDKYVIYLLKPSMLSHPWSDNCALVVLAGEGTIDKDTRLKFTDHFMSGGRILNFGLPLSLGDVSFQAEPPTEREVDATYQGVVKSQPFRVQGLSGPGRLQIGNGDDSSGNVSVSVLGQDRVLPMVVKASEAKKGGMAIFSQVRQIIPSEILAEQKHSPQMILFNECPVMKNVI